jgi:23S rRNA (pseudouridine1915-N3)-methyltransferase
MKVQLYYTGKTTEDYLRTGERIYEKRLQHYLPIAFDVLPPVKGANKMEPQQRTVREGEQLLGKLATDDRLILLDEGGDQYSSKEFANWLDRELQRPARRLVLVVGGAFGFSEAVYARANGKLSLSKMTFSHQMIRLFLTEQLYRAMTILRNEKYHNE